MCKPFYSTWCAKSIALQRFDLFKHLIRLIFREYPSDSWQPSLHVCLQDGVLCNSEEMSQRCLQPLAALCNMKVTCTVVPMCRSDMPCRDACEPDVPMHRVGAETLLQEYGMRVQPEEFRQFAGMGEAHFLRGVAGKYGVLIGNIGALKEIYYGIYLAKVAQSNENIGLPGVQNPAEW